MTLNEIANACTREAERLAQVEAQVAARIDELKKELAAQKVLADSLAAQRKKADRIVTRWQEILAEPEVP